VGVPYLSPPTSTLSDALKVPLETLTFFFAMPYGRLCPTVGSWFRDHRTSRTSHWIDHRQVEVMLVSGSHEFL